MITQPKLKSILCTPYSISYYLNHHLPYHPLRLTIVNYQVKHPIQLYHHPFTLGPGECASLTIPSEIQPGFNQIKLTQSYPLL
jgi:hypothetical protein